MFKSFDVAMVVLKNPIVISTAIVVLLMMGFSCYVANYRKKPKKLKKNKKDQNPAPAAAPVQATEGGEDGEESSEPQRSSGPAATEGDELNV